MNRCPDITVIDPARWEVLAAIDDDELLAQILSAFIEEAPHRLATLRLAVETDDAGSAEREAHTLKGSSATIGVSAVARLAQVIESRGREGDLGGIGTALDDLEKAMETGLDALREVLSDSDGVARQLSRSPSGGQECQKHR